MVDSEAGDKFYIQQEEVGTLEMVEFEDNLFLRRVGLVGPLL